MRNRLLLVFGILIGSIMLIFGVGYLTGEPVFVQDTPIQSSSLTPINDNNCQLSSAYPPEIQQWCQLITQNANQNNIDPNLIAALIWQESGGNSDAYSKDGAVGLMQVMPKDGLAAKFMCPNGPCFANRPSMNELYNPAFNVEYGTQFLANLISRYGNNRDALKYYGPANVDYYYADIVLSLYNNH